MSSELLLYLDLILIISLATFCQTLKQCHPSIYSVYGHYLSRHEVLTTVSSSFSECVTICSIYIRCRSLNFRLGDKSCELNDSDQYTHPTHSSRNCDILSNLTGVQLVCGSPGVIKRP